MKDACTKKFEDAIKAGCIISITSCMCGGRFAWLVPRPSGAYEMHGCICHNDPPKHSNTGAPALI